MRIPKLISRSINNDELNLLFETGESRYFIISHLIETLNASGVGTFKREDLSRSVVDDGILVFPSIQLSVVTPNGVSYHPYDLSPDFVYNESKTSEISIGKAFRMLRQFRGKSQQEIGDRCGTSKGYISKFEASKLQIEWNTLRKLFFMGLEIKLEPEMLIAQLATTTKYQVKGQMVSRNPRFPKTRLYSTSLRYKGAFITTGEPLQPTHNPYYTQANASINVNVIESTIWVKE